VVRRVWQRLEPSLTLVLQRSYPLPLLFLPIYGHVQPRQIV